MFFRALLPVFFLLITAQFLGAAEGGEEHHGLPAYAVEVFRLGPLPVTNSMIVTTIITVLIVGFAQLATRRMEMVPSGLQNFAEWLVEGLFNFLESVMGTDLTRKTFWFFGSIFIFILLTNWFGLIPGIGTVGHVDAEGHFVPYLRGGNADLNMTFALAMAFFVVWFIWAIQENGVVGLFKHIFMPQRAHFLIAAIFIFVGLVEVISIFMRPVALSFRLYGNVFAGENLLETMIHKAGWLAPLIPLPFYFLELLVGIIQATVFMLLTALFTKIICSHEGDHHDHGNDDDHHHGEAVEAEGSAQH